MATVQIQLSADDEALAHRLAHQLVEERLVACAQVLGPITSHYRWQGTLEVAREWLVLLKTEDDRADEVLAAVRERHDATTPELLVLPVLGGESAYLAWVHDETRR
jgi:periplasmic divalent cation tolerance protein